MDINEHEQRQTSLQKAISKWVLHKNPNVFITFTFRGEGGISYERALKIFGTYAHSMKRHLFGKKSKKRILMVPVVEGYAKNVTSSELSKRDERTHVHCLMNLPGNPTDHKDAVRKLWIASSKVCGDPNIYCPKTDKWFCPLETIEDKQYFTNYIFKTCHQDSEAVLWKFVPSGF